MSSLSASFLNCNYITAKCDHNAMKKVKQIPQCAFFGKKVIYSLLHMISDTMPAAVPPALLHVLELILCDVYIGLSKWPTECQSTLRNRSEGTLRRG